MSAADKRAQELQLRVQQGDPSALRVPRVRFAPVVHPFSGADIQRSQCELVYFFPRECLWSRSAKGFGQRKGAAIANSSGYYGMLVEHIFFVATVKESTDNSSGLSDSKQWVTWTWVPSEHDTATYAGFLLRINYEGVNESDINAIVSGQIRVCEEKYNKTVMKGRERLENPRDYQRMRLDPYLNMCDFYNKSLGDHTQGKLDLNLEENPYRPFRVFTMEKACQLMRNSGAATDFCQLSNFVRGSGEDRRVLFPQNGAHTYRIPAAQMNPLTMNSLYFPHVPQQFGDFNEEMINFVRDGGGSLYGRRDDGALIREVDSEASELDAEQAQLRLKKLYEQLCFSSEVEASNSLQEFKKRVSARMAQARRASDADDEGSWFRNRRQAQKDMIDVFFADYFTPDETADCGDALRAIAGWYNEFTSKYRNFKMKTQKFTSNLSRFGDMQVREATQTESAFAITHAHQEIKSLRLSGMHVYYYSPFHCNPALLGPPGSGKSNALSVFLSCLIEDTYRDIGAESAKAKMTPGKKTDLMVEVYEDIPPSQIGVANNTGFKSGTTVTSNTEQEALLKYRLTKGRVKGVYKMVHNGQHMMYEIDSYCNTVMFIGANTTLKDIPRSISDRFNNMLFQYKARKDANGFDQGMFVKYAQAQDRKLEPVKQNLILRYRRNQCMHAIVQLLCWAGVFEKPDMTVPELIWSRTLARAKEIGLTETSNIRHYERLRFQAETLVIEDAIDRLLDSETSPLPDDKFWHPHDLTHIEKHIYGNTGHATFSLGLMQHQWENPIIQAVESYLKYNLLKDKIRTGDVGRHDPVDKVREELSYYYVAPIKNLTSFHSASSMHGGPQTFELIQAFAKHVHRNMLPRPDEQEIVYALECLTALEITVKHKNPQHAGDLINIPALVFFPTGEVLIAEAMMANHEKNRLQKCARQVLSHEHTNPKNILYGHTKENTPFVWQSMKIKPMPGNRLTMEQPSFFSPAVLELTLQAVENVHAQALDAPYEGLTLEDVERGAFERIFSDTNQKCVDMDLDDWASLNQAKRIGLKYTDMGAPDAPEGYTSAEALRRAEFKLLPPDHPSRFRQYPTLFKETQQITYQQTIDADKQQNPERYSLAESVKSVREDFEEFSRLKRMRERQRQRREHLHEGISAAILEEEAKEMAGLALNENEEEERKSQDEEDLHSCSSDVEEMSHASDADVDDGDDEPMQFAPMGALPGTAAVSRFDPDLTDDQINAHFSQVLSQPMSASSARHAPAASSFSCSQPAAEYDAFASFH